MRDLAVVVPYLFQVKVVPPRCRNAVDTCAIDSVPVILRCAELDAMPVAFLFRCPMRPDDHPDSAQEIRWDGSRLWTSDTSDTRITPSEVNAALARMDETPFRSLQKSHDVAWRRATPVPRSQVLGTVVDDRAGASVRAEIVAKAAGIVFCDGRFWQECPEPVWVVIRDFNYNRIEAELAHPHIIKQSGSHKLFAADRMEDAAASLADDSRPDRFFVRGAIETLIPAAKRLPLDDQNLIATAAQVLEFEAKRLHDKPRAFLMAYADVRDELEAIGPDDPMARVTDTLAEATADLIRAWPDCQYGTRPHGRERLEAARKSWVRSFVLEGDAPLALPGTP